MVKKAQRYLNLRFLLWATAIAAICGILLVGCPMLFVHKEIAPYTNLMEAAREGNSDQILKLIRNGANIDEQRGLVTKPGGRIYVHGGPSLTYGETALIVAIENKKVDAVKVLLDHGARTDIAQKPYSNKDAWQSLDFSTTADDESVQILRLLLKYSANETLTANKAYPILLKAIGRNNIYAANLLLPHTTAAFVYEPNKVEAALCEVMRIRFDSSANDKNLFVVFFEKFRPFTEKISPHVIDCMMQTISPEKLEYMLNKGMDPNNPGFRRPLSFVLDGYGPSSGRILPTTQAYITTLLRHGADPRLRDSNGSSALQRANELNFPDLNDAFKPFK
jgi:ankyrin repeat protein